MPQSQELLPLFSGHSSIIDKFLSLHQLRDVYQTASSTGGFHQNLLSQLDIHLRLSDADLARIPRTGPLIIVANHPFGMLEGSILGIILSRVRKDYKIMTSGFLSSLPVLESECIFVDPFQNRASTSRNGSALQESLRWVRDGHMLVVFPAGEVSHWSLRNRAVQDPDWTQTATKLIRKTGSAALPIFFKGINSVPFHLLGMVHPRLRTARLPQELFNKRGKTIEVRVGSVIPPSEIAGLPDNAEATQYLRRRTYLLARRGEHSFETNKAQRRRVEPIAGPGRKESLVAELTSLRPHQQLDHSAEFSVYMAPGSQIPNVLEELGRLREVAFPQVGEGTGKQRDLDRFDSYYEHLILWSRTKEELVGAYRVGNVDRIIACHGIQGLYTTTLFRYEDAFFREIGPALELGRSFIRLEYQKQYAPLLMLWKGLGRYVAQHPAAPTLFGAVSISSQYSVGSRRLIARFLEEHQANDRLAKLVRARRPLPRRGKTDIDDHAICSSFRCLDSLSGVVVDMESDGKGVPVLLRTIPEARGESPGVQRRPEFRGCFRRLSYCEFARNGAQYSGPLHGKNRRGPIPGRRRALTYNANSSFSLSANRKADRTRRCFANRIKDTNLLTTRG